MDRVDLEQWKGREVARLLALVETERRYYQELVAALPVGLAVTSRDGVLDSANRAFRRIFGLRTEDVYRRTLDQLLPSAELAEAVRTLPSRPATSPVFTIDLQGRLLRVSLIPVRDWDDDTEVDVLIVVEELNVDSAKEALRDFPAMIWTADVPSFEFNVIAGEQAGVAHPGMASSQILSDDRERVVEFYRDAFSKPGPHACEYRAVDAAGRLTWYRDSFRVEEKTSRAAGVVTDITARKQSELIAEQGGRLEALTGLSRVLTHDLNNSLMVVSGYSEEMLAALPEHDPRRADLEAIVDGARRIAGTSAQLLAFTRRQAGEPAVVHVAEAMARVVGDAGLETVIPAQLQMLANPGHVEQALRAVLERLRRDDGRVAVEARAVQFSESVPGGLPQGRYIDITFKAPQAAALNFDGLLGSKESGASEVARAHAMVREWRGGMWSSPGEVHVMLPAAADLEVKEPEAAAVEETPAHAAPAEVAPEPAPAPEPEPVPEVKAETILIVEDEPGIRALVRKILRRQNYDVFEAGTPAEAVELVARNAGAIDLLITDMALPERSGRQLAEELKTKIPSLRVLYVSGYTDDPTIYDRELPPGAAFLQKPFTLGSLLKKVREVLDAEVNPES